jgi:hypothetical protein
MKNISQILLRMEILKFLLQYNFDTTDIIKVFEDDSLLMKCTSSYNSWGYIPVACELTYYTTKTYIEIKVEY